MNEQLELPFVPPVPGEIKSMARRLMIEDGLLPTIGARSDQIEAALADLPPDARRATTRRYRKARRVAHRKWQKANSEAPAATSQYKDALVEEHYLKQAKHMLQSGQ